MYMETTLGTITLMLPVRSPINFRTLFEASVVVNVTFELPATFLTSCVKLNDTDRPLPTVNQLDPSVTINADSPGLMSMDAAPSIVLIPDGVIVTAPEPVLLTAKKKLSP